MDPCAATDVGLSRKLTVLAQQLRLYTPPPPSDDDDDDDDEEGQRIEESAGKVVSQVGFAESATQQPAEKFRPKRAAVLVCLFEGDDGEFRVILTKRSARLSTHSGSPDCIFLIRDLSFFVLI